MKQLRLFSLSVLTVVLFLRPILAEKPNTWQSQVNQQLQQATLALDIGYSLTPSHVAFVDSLTNYTYKDVTYRLEANTKYVFVGVCDNDCSDLDLTLYDHSWKIVDFDSKPNAVPVLVVTVYETGDFHLRVTMARCETSVCYFGARAYTPAY